MSLDNSSDSENVDKPPFFKSWNGIYVFLMATLAVLVIFFYAFTQYFK